MGDFDLNTIPQLNEIDSRGRREVTDKTVVIAPAQERGLGISGSRCLIDGNDSAARGNELNVMYLAQADTSGLILRRNAGDKDSNPGPSKLLCQLVLFPNSPPLAIPKTPLLGGKVRSVFA